MNEQAHTIINRFLAAEPGRSFVLPDVTEISRHSAAFLSQFGPEQLAKMSGSELLRRLPHNAFTDVTEDARLLVCRERTMIQPCPKS